MILRTLSSSGSVWKWRVPTSARRWQSPASPLPPKHEEVRLGLGQQTVVVGHVTEMGAFNGLRRQFGAQPVGCHNHRLVGYTEVPEVTLRHAVAAQLLAQVVHLAIV